MAVVIERQQQQVVPAGRVVRLLHILLTDSCSSEHLLHLVSLGPGWAAHAEPLLDALDAIVKHGKHPLVPQASGPQKHWEGVPKGTEGVALRRREIFWHEFCQTVAACLTLCTMVISLYHDTAHG
jgi:hypothetical protein